MLLPKTASVLVLFLVLKCVKCHVGNSASIVIIGAGAAGIAAATKLLENNFTNIKIVEAENRIGGRIHSVQFGDAFTDLGAEYCHGEKDNAVFLLANKFNILMSTPSEYFLFYSNGEYISIDMEEKLFSLAHSIKHRKERNASEDDPCRGMVSVGACVDLNLKKLVGHEADSSEADVITQAHRWLRNYKSVSDSCLNLNDLSLISTYEDCEGDQMLHWSGRGFITVLDIMMKNYPEYKQEHLIERNMFLETKVLEIVNWDKKGQLEVVCDKGRRYKADHVIFTPSVGVLKADYKTLFYPPLPRGKITAIENIGFGAIVKIALYFSSKWWVDEPILGCIWISDNETQLNKKEMSWLRYFTAITSTLNNPNVLVIWFVGEGVPEIEKLPDHEILEGITFLLNKCYRRFNASAPNHILRSSWYSNPHFRGTYSYESVKGFMSVDRFYQDKLGRPLLDDEGVPTVQFSGEATHPTRYATVHGAIDSGYREADRLIKLYNKKL